MSYSWSHTYIIEHVWVGLCTISKSDCHCLPICNCSLISPSNFTPNSIKPHEIIITIRLIIRSKKDWLINIVASKCTRFTLLLYFFVKHFVVVVVFIKQIITEKHQIQKLFFFKRNPKVIVRTFGAEMEWHNFSGPSACIWFIWNLENLHFSLIMEDHLCS